MNDVLITGLGVISHLGNGVDAFWSGLTAAKSAPSRVPDPNARMDLPLMYAVPESALPSMPDRFGDQYLGGASRLAVEAARQAVSDADLGGVAPDRIAVVIGTGMGDSGMHEEWRATGGPQGGPWSPVFSVASAVGAWFGAEGANVSVSNACAASGFGLSLAVDLIRSGEADVVIAGGAEAYSRVALACFNRLGAIDPERCRPFDLHRKGTLFGEGAGVMVLESAAHARARNVPQAYARVAGAGWSCDAHHATAPEPAGTQIARAMRQALAEAGADRDDIGCVVPHGTGTELNDTVESRVLGEVLGAGPDRVPLYSLKALLGHTGGAAASLATVAAAQILYRRTVPPNAPLTEQDPECKVFLPGRSMTPTGKYALVNAYAFGGNNVSLVLQEAGV
ncbi:MULTISPECIES: beta-ketoacyl synthase [Streptomyces]|uniref:beta-ketoacyl-[acyl-carrier-protein] synthase family protein n=1 Tax=Streptomyces TaxID=1883 RepID=UPI00093BFF8D|nr:MULTISPECIES: beta-ketoacyl-[acyl-carrier-protein] synthase family protein [Streptomyces]MBX9421518.1 beta-ketoacyl-[acyl-carrier-protein] synthase family protein [Streptomyces lateritius]OKJ66235.1 3-oxoacyl-ACP synthase [Streptomyces sp. CB02261]